MELHTRSISMLLTGPATHVLLVFAIASFTVTAAHAQPTRTAFVDVNVLPMDSQRVLRHQTVLIENDKIVAVGAIRDVKIPADVTQIHAGETKYLLPGLADMHTHVEDANDLVLYTANGVTTILQMGATYLDMNRVRVTRTEQKIIGPQVFDSFFIDGPSPRGYPFAATAEDAREMVRMAKRHGYEFIKVYNRLSREQFIALADEARKQGLGVVGHAVRSIGIPEALFKGQAMVAHAEEFSTRRSIRGRTRA
jgi:hypothetical protein